MSLLRKTFTHLLVFGLVLGPMGVYADDGSELPFMQQAPAPTQKAKPKTLSPGSPRTPFAAFNTNTFCSKAPEMLEKLNKENDDKMAKLESLKNEIDDAKSYMEILNGVDALRKQYQAGLTELSNANNPQTLAAMEVEKYKTIDNLKLIIRNGLIINAIGLLFKDSKLDTDEAFKVSSLCKNDTSKTKSICGLKQSNKLLDVFAGHPLDPILEDFRVAYRNIQKKNQDSLKADVQKIIESIHPSIEPSAILDMLEKTSPGLTSLMASPQSKVELTKCLTPKSNHETLQACERLLPEVGSKDNFMERLNEKTNLAVASIKNFSQIIDESARANLASFKQEVETYTEQTQAPEVKVAQAAKLSQLQVDETSKRMARAQTTRQARVTAQVQEMAAQGQDARSIQVSNAEAESLKLTPLQSLFYNSNLKGVQLAGLISEQNKTEMEIARKAAADWEAKCVTPDWSELIYCQSVMNSISRKVNDLKNGYKSKLQNIQSQFIKINTDENFKKIETLKKFVAEKYIRMCAQNVAVKNEQIQLGVAVDGECFSGIHTLRTIEGLGSEVDSIISKIKFSQNITASKDSTGTFTKDEMDSFNKVCQAKDYESSYADVCKEITGEKDVRDKTFDTNEWQKMNDKYWVSYDESSKGYSKTERKSNLRVFGEGFLPVVPSMLPMVFGNYMMRQNITNLTNQAMFQKQMLNNYDVYNSNPWMYNYNYFGGNTVYPAYGAGTTSGAGAINTTGFGF